MMRISRGRSQDGIVVGNAYDKYGSRNPLVSRLVRGFDRCLDSLVRLADPSTIHEVGCGEGYHALRWADEGRAVRGSDFSSEVIALARENARDRGHPESIFETRGIDDLRAGPDSADLVVCCEVLEHLQDPESGLRALHRVARTHVILSVPREPLWRILNVARGRYLAEAGNTPGHLQHWSQRAFVELVRRHFEILELRSPLPWTMLLGRVSRR